MTSTEHPVLIGPADRIVVRAVGNDRLTYLDAVLSQRLRDAAPGTATSALELGPHGEPTGVLDLAVLEDEVVLLLAGPQAEEVLGRLAGRTFLSEVTFTELTDERLLRLRGPAADDVIAATGLELEVGRAATWTTTGGSCLVLRWHHGLDIVGDADALVAAREALVSAGAADAEASALDDAEVAAGVPRAPEEITRGRLPEELGLLPTHVHLSKGCYPGQEAVARMWMLGRPRRRLAVLALGDDVATPGTYGESRAGVTVTRVAPTTEGPVGLGFVPADSEPGDEPHPGIRVQRIVGAQLPVPGHDPAMTRRRDR